MAISAGDILTYDGANWVNQPAVAGPFGVGTASPGSPLDVTGDINIGGTGRLLIGNSLSSGNGIIVVQTTRGFQVNSGTTQLLLIDTSFNCTLGGGGGSAVLQSTGNGSLTLRGGASSPVGSVVLGQTASIGTTDTTGFVFIPRVQGTPTGVPGTTGIFANKVPIVYDTTGNKLWIYNGAWKSATFV